MRMFTIDLLGGNTPEAKIFAIKSEKYFGGTRIVSKYMKMFAIVCVFSLNVAWFGQCLVYGSVKGKEWQMNWLKLGVATILFLLLFDMSYEAAMISFVIKQGIIGPLFTYEIRI